MSTLLKRTAGIGVIGASILVLKVCDVEILPAIARVELVAVAERICSAVFRLGDSVHRPLVCSGCGARGGSCEEKRAEKRKAKHNMRI